MWVLIIRSPSSIPIEYKVKQGKNSLGRKPDNDIVIMDEVCVAIYFSLLETRDLLSLMEEKPEALELILTGRYCPPRLIEKADLVTEMQEIKHYYQNGVAARKGIES